MAAKKASRKKAAGTKASTADWKSKRLKGRTFCFSGTLEHGDRKQVTAMIEAEGGKVAASVTAAIDFLVLGKTRGSGPSTAEKKVQSLNQKPGTSIAVLDESGFHQLLVPDRNIAIAMLKAGKAGAERWNLSLGQQWFQGRVDLSGTDFRGTTLAGVDLRHAQLDGADFRQAKLTDCQLADLTGVTFDGAELEQAQVFGLSGCRFKKAKFRSVKFNSAQDCDFSRAEFSYTYLERSCTGCDFSNARMADSLIMTAMTDCRFDGVDLRKTKMRYKRNVNCSLVKANLSEGELIRAGFPAGDLTGANLSKADLSQVDFSDSKLSGAKLNSAKLQNASLVRADLTKADLRNADLFNADFSGAKVTGADFRGAKLDSARFDNVDTSQARNLKPVERQISGSAGVNVRELEKAAQQSASVETSVELLDNGQRYRLQLVSYHGTHNNARMVDADSRWGDMRWSNRGAIHNIMLELAQKAPPGTLLLDTVKVKTSKCPVARTEMQRLALAAWCEVSGLEIPTDEELKKKATKGRQQLKEQQATALAELRGEAGGVAAWNARSQAERKRLGRFRKADLRDVDLREALLREVDLGGADLRGAKIGSGKHETRNVDCRKANLEGATFHEQIYSFKFHDANLRNANFSKATVSSSTFLRADLSGARCRQATFQYCDLSGADLKTAKLARAVFNSTTFDEKTVFPDGFELTDGLVWRGQGKDPRLVEKIAEVQSAGPIDFETFMEQLENNFDQSRLKKAMKMLKAERFQLFAEVEKDSVTGVVKSQTDADLVYSCRLDAEGTFACCTQNLNPCGGLRGALCKHLLVLIVGLTKGEELDPTTINGWIAASKLQAPKLDKDLMSQVFLKYKGAEAGEIDWRPTETVPEDYYAF